MTIEYSDGNAKSLELKFQLEEPTLKHSVNRINDSIHVYCEMKNNCKTISLNLFVNDGDSSRVIPTINDCSNSDRKSTSKIIAEAIIPVFWFSGNQTISCVPFMTDLQLAAYLTSTMSIPACEGDKPTLKHSINRINDSIHVYCEMKNNCKTISLNLFVNDGDSSRVIPTINDCSNPDRKSSSKIIAEAIIPVSWFSGNQTISCVPFMTDLQLAANLTSTMSIPVCEGDNCEPNCKDDPHSIAYFQDKHLCNIFYQCSNGDIFLQKCLNGTSWSHSKCTCVHFDNEICDTKTNKFFQPAMSFEKCAKS
ncbi:uncharacterized protein LOC143067240 [Mytilus galloprovincialis]|uniref:uncharacterized protein LOC143067240 n=1 Tax=Mytilus galloprovincialis TaxID=29158 RepID=UPI003F7B65F8